MSIKKSTHYGILDHWVFDSFILNDKLFVKVLQRFAACLLFNNKLCGKLDSSLGLRIIFDDSLRVSPASLLLLILICDSDNFTFTLLY